MNPSLSILPMVLLCGVSSFGHAGTATSGNLMVNRDGTAMVTGTVIGQWSGCEVDGTCGLWVVVGEQKIGLVTNEGDLECLNTTVAKTASQIKFGKHVKAFGDFKNGQMTFCRSKNFFLQPLP